MAFPREAKRVPTTIGRVGVEFATMAAADTSVDATSAVTIDVLDQAGALLATRSYPVLAHATNAQKTALFNFLKSIRTKAEIEILPDPEPAPTPP